MRHKIQDICLTLGFLSSSWGLLSCSNPGESGGEKRTLGNQSPALPEQSSDASAVPSSPATLSLFLNNSANFQDLQVLVVGQETSYQLRAVGEKSGAFVVSPPLNGRHDILILAKSKASGNTGGESYGIRLSGLDISSDKGLTLPNVQLSPTLTLTGRILLLGASGETSAEVSIPGTPFKASTDNTGAFTLSQIPAGNHDLKASAPGFHQGFIAPSYYGSGSALAPLTLFDEQQKLSEGIHYLGSPLARDIAVRVTCALVPPSSSYTSMRYGFSSDLATSSWQELRSSIDLNLKEEVRTIFVQFSHQGRQPSQVYSVAIPAP